MSPVTTKLVIEGNPRAVRIERDGAGVAYLRIGVIPASIRLRAKTREGRSAIAELTTTLQSSDRNADGTPDFLRLPAEDQQAFRRWFTFLSEIQYFRDPSALPKEINDCAALLRYAYRQSLSDHNAAWANQLKLPLTPSLPAVRKYNYPYTPLGAALFRVKPGGFQIADLSNGAFAEFADAQSLEKWNCRRISRNLTEALPGDLLFFKQIAEVSHLPFHSMIYLGHSQIEPDGKTYVIYHTGGPEGIRRLTTEQLMGYPLPQWRPLPGNENFLGVYRWNILR
jgi:uncharacterized protein